MASSPLRPPHSYYQRAEEIALRNELRRMHWFRTWLASYWKDERIEQIERTLSHYDRRRRDRNSSVDRLADHFDLLLDPWQFGDCCLEAALRFLRRRPKGTTVSARSFVELHEFLSERSNELPNALAELVLRFDDGPYNWLVLLSYHILQHLRKRDFIAIAEKPPAPPTPEEYTDIMWERFDEGRETMRFSLCYVGGGDVRRVGLGRFNRL